MANLDDEEQGSAEEELGGIRHRHAPSVRCMYACMHVFVFVGVCVSYVMYTSMMQ